MQIRLQHYLLRKGMTLQQWINEKRVTSVEVFQKRLSSLGLSCTPEDLSAVEIALRPPPKPRAPVRPEPKDVEPKPELKPVKSKPIAEPDPSISGSS